MTVFRRYKAGRKILIFGCDNCDTEESFPDDDFTASWHALKEDGWKATKLDDDETWIHTCPDCTS